MSHRFLAVGWIWALALIAGESAIAADIYIVTNSEMNLSVSEIREIFLGDREFNGSMRLVPVDNQAVQVEFTSKVLAMAVDRYSTLWTKRVFRDAVNPPVQKVSDQEVFEFVRKTHGAIGYVSSAPRDKGVAVVAKF